MKRLTALAIALSMIFCLSGCAVSDWAAEQKDKIFPSEEESATDTVADEKPNIINAGIYDFDTFNPLTTKSQSVSEAMQLVYEPLFEIDEAMRAVPVIAKDFSVSPDGKTITVNIKDNIKWHDGSSLTAQDVAYTMKVIRRGETNYTRCLYNVSDYMMMGDYSVQITLNYPVPSYESLLTFPIVKYNTDMSAGAEYVPNGTGPFCYGSKANTNEYYFGAFSDYHEGRANIDALYIHMLENEDEYMSMFEASEIDFSSADIIDLTKYMPKSNLQLYDYIENDMMFIGFNMTSEILSGANTRRGISELIDKTKIVENVIFSRGQAVDLPFNPSSYVYYDTNTSFKSDELTANDYLGNDGWGTDRNGTYIRTVNGVRQELRLEMLVNSDNEEQVNIASAVAEQLQKCGIDITLTTLVYDEYIARITARQYDIFVGETTLDNNMDLSPLLTSNENYFGYVSETLDTLTAQLGMTRNEDEIKELFHQYGDTFMSDMPFTPLYFKKGSLIASVNVKSGISPSVSSLFRKASEWSVR